MNKIYPCGRSLGLNGEYLWGLSSMRVCEIILENKCSEHGFYLLEF